MAAGGQGQGPPGQGPDEGPTEDPGGQPEDKGPPSPPRNFPLVNGLPQRAWDAREFGQMRRWYKGKARPLDKKWTLKDIRRDALAQRLLNEGLVLTDVTEDNVVGHATDRLRSLMWVQFSIPAE